MNNNNNTNTAKIIKDNNNIIKRGFVKNDLLKFDDNAKGKFLDLYLATPNIGKVARVMGFNRRTIHRHLEQDKAFQEAYQEVIECLCDNAEEYMIGHGLTKGGFMDRIAYLKAHRAMYQDRMRVEHKHEDRKALEDLYERIPKSKIIDVKAS